MSIEIYGRYVRIKVFEKHKHDNEDAKNNKDDNKLTWFI